MDDFESPMQMRFLREKVAIADVVPRSAVRFEREDARLFAFSFAAGFLFFLTWLS